MSTLNDMLKAVEGAHAKGKGIPSMELLVYGDLSVRVGLVNSLNLSFIQNS